MEASATETIFRNPLGVTSDEEGQSIIRVTIVLPGIKKKFSKNKLANGTLDVKFDSRSFDAKVMTEKKENGKKTCENFRYQIKRLPDEIVPDKCRHKVEDNKLVLFLHKAQPRSWAPELDQNGLEMDRDEDDQN